MAGRIRLLHLAFFVGAWVATAALAQPPVGVVSGTVSIAAPYGQANPIPGVTLTLACPNAEPRTEMSDDQGRFRFDDVPADTCSIVAELQGLTSMTKAVVVKSGRTTDLELRLDLEALHAEITVTGHSTTDTNPIAARVETINAKEMQTAPIASERFQDALPLIPGVVRGPDGLLNISGTRSNESALMFNNADATDPVTGEVAVELPIDAVSSVQVRGAAFAPEFGLSAGAVTTVETQRGGDTWHVTLNDLEPRLRRRGGKFQGIESWTPRFTIGGPIVKGKLSFLESVQYEYSQTRVFGLPPLESDTKRETFESFSRVDWTPSTTNHVTGAAMVSPRKTTYAGLNTFNPQPVTPDIKNHNLFVTASDQLVVGESALLESRVSLKQFDTTVYASQGTGPMILAPDVNSGSYFNDQDRTSRRAEWFTTYTFTPLGPPHVVKIGSGLAYETFDGISRNRPVEIVRENGTLSQNTSFVGEGLLDRHRTALRGFAQDTWTLSSRLTLQYGGRYDYDSVTSDINLAPRGSFTAMVTGDGRTMIRGGVGLFYDVNPLNVFSFDELQDRLVRRFAIDGLTSTGPAILVSNRTASPTHTPRSFNWSLELDREWVKDLFVRVRYQLRNTRFEPILDLATPDGETALLLRSDGESRYREAQITGTYRFHGNDQIVASYTRSSAIGDLNDFNTYFGNIENPVIEPNSRGPLNWDAPSRYLFWSNITLPRSFSVFPVLDIRTGFPLSIVDEDRNFVVPRNEGGRYPTFVSLDLQVSKRLRVFGHNATVGIKIFNITDHFNPRDFQGNIASAAFGSFNNSVGRTFRGKWVFEF